MRGWQCLVLVALVVAGGWVIVPQEAVAHGGRLNGSGCHNDNVNGGYHCHRGGGGSDSSANSSDRIRPSNEGRHRQNMRRMNRQAEEERRALQMELDRQARQRQRQADKWEDEIRQEGRRRQERYDEWQEEWSAGRSSRDQSSVPSSQIPSPRARVVRPSLKGSMDDGLRDLINGQMGVDACAGVADYAILGSGFRAVCTNGGTRFEVQTNGRTNRVLVCSTSGDPRAPC